MKLNVVATLALLLIWGCARAPVKDRSEAMRKASSPPAVSDDLQFESLVSGINANADFLEKSSRGDLIFGQQRIDKKKYISALRYLTKNSEDKESFYKSVYQNFDFYEVYGNENWSEIKATSYYSPVLKGSKKKTKKLWQPLYSTPKDILVIDVDEFVESFPKWKVFKEQILEQRSSRSLIKARLVEEKNGPSRIVPYYKREDIDEKEVYKKEKDLVIAYVDPIDSFFLQIQGSGIIEMEDGSRFTVGYANQNGHPYVAIGSLLLDKIPKEKMSMQALQSYLRTLSKKEMQKILNKNPSYVFFQKIESKPIAFLGTEVVDGRTVATDNGLFPKGALAFLEFEKPIFESLQATEPVEWKKSARFVLDQDTGGAIRGPGRLDLYAGGGPEAEQFAGVMKNPARLFYLVPKPEFIRKLD
ncbi:MAG: transglycosylase [Pseudobdellovibrio sp.]|jgi:membrane-bound lytic murein transglycosylase A|nr:transglycosylase [Pseudobdellovibrio sp.]